MAREETESTGPGLLLVPFVLAWLGMTAWLARVGHVVNTFNTVLAYGALFVLVPLGTGTLGWVCGRHRRIAFAGVAYVVFTLIYFIGPPVWFRIQFGQFPALKFMLGGLNWSNLALFGSYFAVFLLTAFVGRGVRTKRERKEDRNRANNTG